MTETRRLVLKVVGWALIAIGALMGFVPQHPGVDALYLADPSIALGANQIPFIALVTLMIAGVACLVIARLAPKE